MSCRTIKKTAFTSKAGLKKYNTPWLDNTLSITMKGVTWTGELIEPAQDKTKEQTTEPLQMAQYPVVYPDGAFGRTAPPDQPKAVLVQNATIWTSGPKGNIENGDLLIRQGKIDRVGTNLTAPPGTTIIDAAGSKKPKLFAKHNRYIEIPHILEAGEREGNNW